MTAVILQPSYLPWRGYFHQMLRSDVFVFYDDVQYDKHGWRNRNRIKTPNGLQWLTVPVHARGAVSAGVPIHQIRIDGRAPWARKHWTALTQAYARAPHFARYRDELQTLLLHPHELLADLCIDLSGWVARQLGIGHTRFLRSSELNGITGARTERLLAILNAVGARHYLSGPSARNYLEEDRLREAGVTVEYMVYDYPEYPQLYPPFEPRVSILDLLFMTGPEARRYLQGA